MSDFTPETVVQFTPEELEEYWNYFTDQIETNPNPMARDAADLCLQMLLLVKEGVDLYTEEAQQELQGFADLAEALMFPTPETINHYTEIWQ